MGLSESLDDLAHLADLPSAECFGPLSALQAEFHSPRYRSAFESLQVGVAEQIAQLQEGFAEVAGAAASDAMDQIGLLGFLPQLKEAANIGLSDHIETLKSAMADDDLEFVSARDLTKLQITDICDGAAFAQESPLAALQAMLKDMALNSGELSDGVPSVTGLSGLTYIPGVSGTLPDTGFIDSYLDDLRESIRDYAEELEHLSCVPSTAFPESVQLPTWREHTSTLGAAHNVDLEKLGARHGTQFTVKQVLAFEAVARTAERLLSIRDRRKIASKLGYIRWAASFGSKLLRLYVGLLYILWHLLGKDLLTTQKLCNKRLRRFVKCLSPPPVQPLSRLPKVKPNAPNVAA